MRIVLIATMISIGATVLIILIIIVVLRLNVKTAEMEHYTGKDTLLNACILLLELLFLKSGYNIVRANGH